MLDLKLARCPTCSSLPSRLYLDHSRGPVLAPAILAVLPSNRAIETRSLPRSLAATHRGFAFYVAFPKRSIPSLATCSMSLIPFALFFLQPSSFYRSWFVSDSAANDDTRDAIIARMAKAAWDRATR